MPRGHGGDSENGFSPPSQERAGVAEVRAEVVDDGQDIIQELAGFKDHPDIAGSELAEMLDRIVNGLTGQSEEIRSLQVQTDRTPEQEKRFRGLVQIFPEIRALKRLDHIRYAFNTAPAYFVSGGRSVQKHGPHYEEKDVLELGPGLGTLAVRPDLMRQYFAQHPEALQSGRTVDEAVRAGGFESSYSHAVKEWRQARVKIQLKNLLYYIPGEKGEITRAMMGS